MNDNKGTNNTGTKRKIGRTVRADSSTAYRFGFTLYFNSEDEIKTEIIEKDLKKEHKYYTPRVIGRIEKSKFNARRKI